MPELTAQMVKDLRDKTGAGMMDCKRALAESGGDMEAAIDWLRKKGLSAAAKKSGRVAAEGLVAVASGDKKAAAVEVNAETDFVARNERFQAFALKAAGIVLRSGVDAEGLKTQIHEGSTTVGEALTELIATIGEHMSIRRAASLKVSQGIVATYVHNALTPHLGKIGVLVALESAADPGKLMELGKQLAMHVAAARPEVLTIKDVDPKNIEREKAIFAEDPKAKGKPPEILAKMMEGKLRKYYEDVVLMEQLYVVDGESRIKDVIEKAGKTLGAPVALTGFIRYQLGEGIDKTTDDFAAEVAKMAG